MELWPDGITCLIAHPDDEVIFMWPALRRAKRIVCCSSDLNNPERAWCKDRKKALYEVGAMIGAEVQCLDYNSEFYRVNTRNGDLNKLVGEALKLLGSAECIFTHNPWGEYGHLDHILVHQIARASGKKLLYTEIHIDAGWFPVKPWFPQESIDAVVNDISFYEKCKAIYDKYGCWTWSKPPIKETVILCES